MRLNLLVQRSLRPFQNFMHKITNNIKLKDPLRKWIIVIIVILSGAGRCEMIYVIYKCHRRLEMNWSKAIIIVKSITDL